ncbi:hypothetical protein GUJ93_ZPchr0002g24049 [Zizania palustris]|uniref:Uncharacterized protein n=1 Tax=Zizania palustris TaxID=103762 RepID=A0A8J5S0R3_ZIZPA|nr:hypothetical protein GUJ93_ZPchr0002g24049 [Zizania palustris]
MAFLAMAAAPGCLSPSCPLPTLLRPPRGHQSHHRLQPDRSSTPCHQCHVLLGLTASAVFLLASTTSAITCTLALPPPPLVLTVTVYPDDLSTDDSNHFERLILKTASLARFNDAEAARARLSTASVANESDSMLQRCRKLDGDELNDDFAMLISPADAEETTVEPQVEVEKL